MTSNGPATEGHDLSAPVKLPADIVTLVLIILRDTSPKTLASVALTCRTYCTLVRYCHYRTLVLPLRRPELVATRLQHIEQHDLLPAIREVVVQDACVDLNQARIAILADLGRLLPQMSGLRDLSWPEPLLPRNIVRWNTWELDACPDVRLHAQYSYSRFTGYFPFDTLPSMNLVSLRSLAGFSNLSSLVVKAEYTGVNECLEITRPLKRILLTCKRLRSLHLDIGLVQSVGCDVYEPLTQYCGLGLGDNERPSALSELTVFRYPFGVGEEAYWAEAFDWSRLKTFQCNEMSLVAHLAPKLVSLTDLSIGCSYRDEIELFNELPVQLESISVPCDLHTWGFSSVLFHGKTLRRLRLNVHNIDDEGEKFAPRPVTSDQLLELARGLPLLEELSIDLAHDASWPLEELGLLRTDFPSLKHLSTWFQLGPPETPIEPKLTFEAAADLFRLLCKPRGTSTRTGLETAEFHTCGVESDAVRCKDVDDTENWSRGMKTTFLCEFAERDDERRAGHFYVSCLDCPELRARDDLVADVVGRARTRGMMEYPSCEIKRLRIAVDGPVSVEEFATWDYQGLFD